MRRILLTLALLALAVPLYAHADDLITGGSLTPDTGSTFDFTNVTTGGGTITGTVDIDTTTGMFTGIDATYTAGSVTNSFTDNAAIQIVFGTDSYVGFFNSTNGAQNEPGGAQLALLLPGASLIGYTGGDVCSFNEQCDGVISVVYLPNTSAVPEPSTLMMLGTGLFGAFGAVRRRLIA